MENPRETQTRTHPSPGPVAPLVGGVSYMGFPLERVAEAKEFPFSGLQILQEGTFLILC